MSLVKYALFEYTKQCFPQFSDGKKIAQLDISLCENVRCQFLLKTFLSNVFIHQSFTLSQTIYHEIQWSLK